MVGGAYVMQLVLMYAFTDDQMSRKPKASQICMLGNQTSVLVT